MNYIINNTRKNSIKFIMIIVFCMIFLAMTVGISTFYIIENLSKANYEHFVDMNVEVNRLPVLANSCNKNIQSYFREKNNMYLYKYIKDNKEIEEILNNLNENEIYSSEIATYLRVISNMHSYQEQLVSEMVSEFNFGQKLYDDISYIKILFEELNNQCQLLSMQYFDYSNKAFSIKEQESKELEAKLITIIIVLVFLSFGIAMAFLLNFLNALKRLTTTAEQLSLGKWHIVDVNFNRFIEFNTVAKAFNKMKNAIKVQIEELKEKSRIEIELEKEKTKNVEKNRLIKEAQLLSLQRQMNPHFLFNTLNMIGKTAMLSNIELSLELIEAISQILRYCLNNDKEVTLDDEIQIIQRYMFIQESRFSERLKFTYQNDIGNINSIIMPPMILQPIIENSIIHGLKDIEEDGHVICAIERSDGYINIIIEDNGIGISKDIINSIDNEDGYGNSGSIGLINVKKRLEYFYNKKGLLMINSRENLTSITIKIPLERGL